MPKIEVIEPCLVAGQHREAGDIVEINDEDARLLHHNPRVALLADEAPVEAPPVDEAKPDEGKPDEGKAKK